MIPLTTEPSWVMTTYFRLLVSMKDTSQNISLGLVKSPEHIFPFVNTHADGVPLSRDITCSGCGLDAMDVVDSPLRLPEEYDSRPKKQQSTNREKRQPPKTTCSVVVFQNPYLGAEQVARWLPPTQTHTHTHTQEPPGYTLLGGLTK